MAQDGAPFLTRSRPERPAQDFAALRDTALARIQGLAAKSWTDHNAHDPGITILEAFCYAMTELGLKLDLDMRDLIASARSPASLPQSSAVLPVAPVTTEDFRRALIDHYLLEDARISHGTSEALSLFADPGNSPPLAFSPPVPDAERVTPSGLSEILIAFRDAALNSNTYSIQQQVDGSPLTFEFALPNWDEDESAPFLDGATVIGNAAMEQPAAPWHPLAEGFTYYGRATLDFTAPGGPGSVETWTVLRIIGLPDDTPALVPLALDAARAAFETIAAGAVLMQYAARVSEAARGAGAIGLELQILRNLTEDVSAIAVSRVQEIGVNARIEVARTAGLEELLADILHTIDKGLAPPGRFVDPETLRVAGQTPDAILNGPLLGHGIPAEPETAPMVRGDRVILSDVLNLIMERSRLGTDSRDDGTTASTFNQGPDNPLGRDIVAVTELSLTNFVDNRAITSGAKECLQLVDSARYRPRLGVSKCRITLVRDEIVVNYDLARVEALVAEARAAEEATARLPDFAADHPQMPGIPADIGAYYPFQYDLPLNFGVSEHGLGPDADTTRQQQALQLRGFLMLMEQVLSDASEGLANINRFFSPDAQERQTYFPQPLFELAGAEELIRRVAGPDWQSFVDDPANSHRQALDRASEDTDTALDRRNRMLDHLMARQGEEMTAWGQEHHRWAQQSLLQNASLIPPADLPARIAERRRQANTALVTSKAGFLADLPQLHALRFRSFGDPSSWDTELIATSGVAGAFRWTISAETVPVFQAPDDHSTRAEAATRAREVLRLSADAANWDTINLGGPNNRRFILRDGPNPADAVIAHSVQGFATQGAAAAAGNVHRGRLSRSITRASRCAMDRWIDHQIGVRPRGMRRLATALSTRFDVVDEPAAPAFTKRWRLRERNGPAGPVLLEAAMPVFDPAEPEAIAAANAAAEAALAAARDHWNWRIGTPAPGVFDLQLVDDAGTTHARTPASFPDRAAAEAAREQIFELIDSVFGAEGFHSVETLLLRPRSTVDPILLVPDGDGGLVTDPYSHRIIFVLPSGYQRDFPEGSERSPARPHRFREPEFRAHAERMIRRACPAHVIATICWVDRQLPDTALVQASFDGFEQRYRGWLATQVTPGLPDTTIATRRRRLTSSLNAILRQA